MNQLLHSKFETYLLDEEQVEKVQETTEKTMPLLEKTIYPEGFFTEL